MVVLIRGGGDLASGIALRLAKVGIPVVVTELPKPLAIRRLVSFAEAIYQKETMIEGIIANRVEAPEDLDHIHRLLALGQIPVVVDPLAKSTASLKPIVLIDARMLKQDVSFPDPSVPLVIGLGPCFTAGVNCHAVIETQRGHTLGRVYWDGTGQHDSGIPDSVLGITQERVLRAPIQGEFTALASIGESLVAGQPVAEISSEIVRAPFNGVLRGMLRSGLIVTKGFKVGDIDPRNDPRLCTLVSDKALAVGGGVLEAILTKNEIRKALWD